ncbi:MAG: hypothetical protein JST00_07755 [Deltaproteobacteria bacterium]|nr:hypothetical protein [Deltaproteobacteria bacterium]
MHESLYSAHRWTAAAIALTAATAAVAISGCSSDDGRPEQGGGVTTVSANIDPSAPKKKAAEVCQVPAECESNVCFSGGNQSFCSVACTPENAATVCAAPFTGSCNKKGFCKRD